MSLRTFYGLVVLVLFFSGCGAPKVLVSYKDNAETATSQGNYSQATDVWEQYFNQTPIEETTGSDFARAAKTAFKSGNSDLALNWFDQARYKNYADAEMYAILAKIFKANENISKELDALQYLTENFSENSKQINDRLFDVYFEIGSNEKALQIWERLDADSKNDLLKLDQYFSIQLNLKDTSVCDSVSLVLLEKNPAHIEALEWVAKKYYWLGENRYQSEMEMYNSNKTTRQYKILLEELDLATEDFKKSLSYFETLWNLGQEKKYASYFANIYARFGDEKKSESYQKFLE